MLEVVFSVSGACSCFVHAQYFRIYQGSPPDFQYVLIPNCDAQVWVIWELGAWE